MGVGQVGFQAYINCVWRGADLIGVVAQERAMIIVIILFVVVIAFILAISYIHDKLIADYDLLWGNFNLYNLIHRRKR